MFVHDGITVHFARDSDADAMIEDLIAAHHTPRTLTVVSSDHRIQRALAAEKQPPSTATAGTPNSGPHVAAAEKHRGAAFKARRQAQRR